MRVVRGALIGALLIVACGDGDARDAASGARDGRDPQATSGSTGEAGDDAPPSSARVPGESRTGAGLSDALADARAVDLPDMVAILDFYEAGAPFRAADASSYIESVEATVVDSTGTRVYWLDLTIAHAAEPAAFHALGTIGGTAPQWQYMGVAWGLHDRFEVIGLGDEFWTRSPDDWSGPKSRDYVTWLALAGPARLMSSRAGIFQSTDSVGVEVIEGRRATQFRIIDDRSRIANVWYAVTTDLPSEPVPFGTTGTVDLWMMENGLVLRARLDARAPNGNIFRASLDLRDFDSPVRVEPPSR